MYWHPTSHHYSDPLSMSENDHEITRLNRDFKKFIDAVQRIGHPKETAEMPLLFGFALEPDSEGRPMLQHFGMEADQTALRKPYVKIVEEYAPDQNNHQPTIITGYNLIFEMPGVKKKELDIQTRGRYLTVRAVGKVRSYASRFRLPENINPSVTTAAFENGILTLQLRFLKPQHKGHAIITIE